MQGDCRWITLSVIARERLPDVPGLDDRAPGSVTAGT